MYAHQHNGVFDIYYKSNIERAAECIVELACELPWFIEFKPCLDNLPKAIDFENVWMFDDDSVKFWFKKFGYTLDIRCALINFWVVGQKAHEHWEATGYSKSVEIEKSRCIEMEYEMEFEKMKKVIYDIATDLEINLSM